VRPYIIEALGAKIDEATLFGVDKPASFPEAIVDAAITAGQSTQVGDTEYSAGNSDIAADVNEVMGDVEEAGFGVTGFATRIQFKGRLRGLRDQNGGPIFNPSLTGETPSRLYDVPIVYPDGNGAWAQTDAQLIAGDWTKAILGIRQDITFQMFTDGVISDDDGKVILNLMQQDSSAMRVVMRVGFVVANPISRRGGSGYPFAVLQGDTGS
jgi:HK97 family phage major capsid protein